VTMTSSASSQPEFDTAEYEKQIETYILYVEDHLALPPGGQGPLDDGMPGG